MVLPMLKMVGLQAINKVLHALGMVQINPLILCLEQLFYNTQPILVPMSMVSYLLIFFNYTGQYQNNNQVLRWSTVNEKQFDFFKAEVSEDGLQWVQYKLRKEILSSRSNQNNYSETIRPAITPNYIRIVAVDIDGSETKTRIFSQDKTTKSGFDVYPNPSSLNHIDFSCFDCSPKGST